MVPEHIASAVEILVVEDDLSLQLAISRVLSAAGYAVSCHADAPSMLEHLANRRPEHLQACLLLDINLGRLSGIDAQRQARALDPRIPVVFISADENAHNVQQAWRGGASDFLFKPFTSQELLAALEQALRRMQGLPIPPIAPELVDRVGKLTLRQRQVFQAVAHGQSHQDIAQRLGISTHTVKLHRAAVMQTLGCQHLTDLVRNYELCKNVLDIN